MGVRGFKEQAQKGSSNKKIKHKGEGVSKYGLEVYDKSGNTIVDSNDRIGKIVFSKKYTEPDPSGSFAVKGDGVIFAMYHCDGFSLTQLNIKITGRNVTWHGYPEYNVSSVPGGQLYIGVF